MIGKVKRKLFFLKCGKSTLALELSNFSLSMSHSLLTILKNDMRKK